MWIVRLALRRPHTFVVMAIAIALLGSLAIVLTPTDIFPQINIPVGSVIWIYPGMAPDEMEGRIVTICERAMTTTVNSIEQIVPIIRYRPFRNDAPGITLEFDRRRAIRQCLNRVAAFLSGGPDEMDRMLQHASGLCERPEEHDRAFGHIGDWDEMEKAVQS